MTLFTSDVNIENYECIQIYFLLERYEGICILQLDMIDGVFNNTLTTATGLFLSSFSFVTGLAWNDAITASIDEYVNLKKDKVISKVFYALIITGIMVIIGYLIESWKEGSIITVIPMK